MSTEGLCQQELPPCKLQRMICHMSHVRNVSMWNKLRKWWIGWYDCMQKSINVDCILPSGELVVVAGGPVAEGAGQPPVHLGPRQLHVRGVLQHSHTGPQFNRRLLTQVRTESLLNLAWVLTHILWKIYQSKTPKIGDIIYGWSKMGNKSKEILNYFFGVD